jgi:MinD superfamily P-loop ATPase
VEEAVFRNPESDPEGGAVMRQLLILSGKGGTGKTTVAGALIRLSKAAAFADCDVDAPNLTF